VSLDGTVVHADKDADRAMYGAEVDRHAILGGKLPAPASAAPLRHELAEYTK
jgi:lipid-binding SYLF domain-containing protein